MEHSVAASGTRLRVGLGLSGMALIGWSLAFIVEVPGADLPRYVALTVAAWLVYLAALRIVFALHGAGWRRDLVLIFVIAIAMRAPLIVAPPSLSDDVYRAVWDARLI